MFLCICVWVCIYKMRMCECVVDVVQSLSELSVATVWSKSVKTFKRKFNRLANVSLAAYIRVITYQFSSYASIV